MTQDELREPPIDTFVDPPDPESIEAAKRAIRRIETHTEPVRRPLYLLEERKA